MLQAKEIQKRFKRKVILSGIDLQLNPGEIVGLLGPNGAGKTTFFYTLVGLLAPNHGQIFLDNKIITKLPMHKRSQLGICYLPQTPSLFEKMTVTDNLLCAMEIIGIDKKERKKLLEKSLKDFSIERIRDSYGFLFQEEKSAELKSREPYFLNHDFFFLMNLLQELTQLQSLILKK